MTMTLEQLHARIAEIDKQIIALEDGLGGVSAKFEDGTSPDDNAVEAEEVNQELGGTNTTLSALRHEKAELQAQLDAFQ